MRGARTLESQGLFRTDFDGRRSITDKARRRDRVASRTHPIVGTQGIRLGSLERPAVAECAISKELRSGGLALYREGCHAGLAVKTLRAPDGVLGESRESASLDGCAAAWPAGRGQSRPIRRMGTSP